MGPRRALTGEPLAPVLPATAAAQAAGLINRRARRGDPQGDGQACPASSTPPTRAQIEVDLVRIAVGVGPKELKDAADRTLFLLDQDGPEPDDTERARKRGVSVGQATPRRQRCPSTGDLTPEAWAVWEAIFAKYAAPGMCNPDDDEPLHLRAHRHQAQIDNDHRSLAQRRHDAHDRHRPHRPDERGTRPAQRAPGIDHHPHDPAGPRIPRRVWA